MKELRRERWHWDQMAAEDPMFYILTDPARRGSWDPTEFFETGRQEIESSLQLLEREAGIRPRFGTALDFGSGLGRLTQALADRFANVHGVDISATMVSQAQAHNRHGARVQHHANPTDRLPMLGDGSIDFIYSRLVLQHIPVTEMRSYIVEFGRVLAPGGTAMFQILTRAIPWSVRLRHRLREVLPNAYRAVRDLVSPRARFELNTLPASTAGQLLSRHGASIRRVIPEGSSDRVFESTWIIAQKNARSDP